MGSGVSIISYAYSLAHVPDVVRYGSKPAREAALLPALDQLRRTFREAVAYAPNQVYIGAMAPQALWPHAAPWWQNLLESAQPTSSFGEMVDQATFYRLLQQADQFDLVKMEPSTADAPGALALYEGDRVVGSIHAGLESDEDLRANVLLENLSAKVTAYLAFQKAMQRIGCDPTRIEYVMTCGEEAVGDRYQRGAGNLAKAVAEMAGCVEASGADIKAFCCSPIHSLVLAASLIEAGIYETVAVVAGGSLAKLGMKMRGSLDHQIPVLEDVLAGAAFILTKAQPHLPRMRLDSVGRHRVASGSNQVAIWQDLVTRPLERIGRRIPDIDRFATELHNPEVTEPAGSGNVPKTNYRMIGSLAVSKKQWAREQLNDFEQTFGLPGWAPTQGHIASAIPYLGHAIEAMQAGELRSAMFIGKGSLFLGKMTRLSDGYSFVLDRA